MPSKEVAGTDAPAAELTESGKATHTRDIVAFNTAPPSVKHMRIEYSLQNLWPKVHAGPGLDDLAGAAWESSQEDGDECGSGHDTAAVAVVGAPLCKESASRRGHLTDGRAPADQVEKAHAAADYDSDATQCSDEGASAQPLPTTSRPCNLPLLRTIMFSGEFSFCCRRGIHMHCSKQGGSLSKLSYRWQFPSLSMQKYPWEEGVGSS